MLKFILILIVFFVLVTLFTSRQLPGKQRYFDRVLDVDLIAIGIHAVFAFTARTFFSYDKYIDTLAPFGLMYGPLLYFTLKSAAIKLNRRAIALHLTPFVLYFILYFLLLASITFRNNYRALVGLSLYTLIPISMISYSLWALFVGYKQIKSEKSTYVVFRSMGLWLLLIALLMISIMFSKTLTGEPINVSVPGLIIYGSMLFCVARIFGYKLAQIKKIPTALDQTAITTELATKYTKSTLPSALLMDYEARVEHYFREESPFLSPEFTLGTLSDRLKIPAHHLTQMFSLQLNENFNRYTNRHRIEHACKLLKKGYDRSIEELAFECGFANKSNFNRHFKLHTGKVPSQYTTQR